MSEYFDLQILRRCLAIARQLQITAWLTNNKGSENNFRPVQLRYEGQHTSHELLARCIHTNQRNVPINHLHLTTAWALFIPVNSSGDSSSCATHCQSRSAGCESVVTVELCHSFRNSCKELGRSQRSSTASDAVNLQQDVAALRFYHQSEVTFKLLQACNSQKLCGDHRKTSDAFVSRTLYCSSNTYNTMIQQWIKNIRYNFNDINQLQQQYDFKSKTGPINLCQHWQCLNHLGNGMVSLMFGMPSKNCSSLSKPRPKPPDIGLPRFLSSKYLKVEQLSARYGSLGWGCETPSRDPNTKQ